jgi:cytochrome o ubiquinol oxidase subunit 1
MIVALLGAAIIFLGIILTIVQLVVSIRTREQRRDLSGDPWNGRTLEWSTSSPPPEWNFAVLPTITGPDAFWSAKRRSGLPAAPAHLVPLTVPKHSALGFSVAFCAVILGFSLIWHIWWLAILGLAGEIAVTLRHAWRTDLEDHISVAAIAEHERAHQAQAARA